LRAFVALEIADDAVLGSLVSYQRELAATGADLKLVERENLHFTLKFLGEVSEDQAREADRRLRALRLAGGPATVSGAGAFPSLHRPSVVWVGVSQADEQRVRAVGEAVIKALEGIGERETRPFQAHLTLARVRSVRNMDRLSSAIGAASQRGFGAFSLGSFKLKSSQLRPSGPVYSDLGVYELV
jgi:RNA 2',3'-cyclic 3'-phosphodiesterase